MSLLSNLKLLWKCYPIAKSRVLAHQESKYLGTVRMQIAYNETRTEIVRRGIKEDDITGAVVYLAISLAYLLNKHNK
jgi:hypothetical protein